MKNNKKETSLNKENKKKYEYKLIYYVVCYVIGYIISLCVSGVPSLIYLIPIKEDSLAISTIMGTICNLHHYNISGNSARHYMFKPALILIVTTVIMLIIIKVAIALGVITDPNPFFGFIK
ncbi:hypothetical protein HBE96_09095 [Clostridium sp. P21]|uniref:Uncharacterized protein n=1 Tax=Clostridium muellerianum TaxID=2716538 RepID=A0A7Y0HPM1_9CLOT|nr:hypothetical protein [Clostridium muellerianum]NMM62853.1 hypothetical protein [Clostridium muellerianum]